MLGTESLVHCFAAGHSDSEVQTSIPRTERVEGCGAVASAAAYDCALTAAATDTTLHAHSVRADAVKALVGIADVAGDDTQIRLPKDIYLQMCMTCMRGALLVVLAASSTCIISGVQPWSRLDM